EGKSPTLLRARRRTAARWFGGVSLWDAAVPPQGGKPWARRIGWLVLLWTASVAALGIVAPIFHVLMSLAGLTAGGDHFGGATSANIAPCGSRP
ncbi:MAG: DUF2474 domain-containing protein, partial [Methylovirgula sp.]